nr:putative nuclease HARBI1 [Tanacetum cinerariifolium]
SAGKAVPAGRVVPAGRAVPAGKVVHAGRVVLKSDPKGVKNAFLKTGKAHDVPFVANDVTYKRGYYLTDEIYPECLRDWHGFDGD